MRKPRLKLVTPTAVFGAVPVKGLRRASALGQVLPYPPLAVGALARPETAPKTVVGRNQLQP